MKPIKKSGIRKRLICALSVALFIASPQVMAQGAALKLGETEFVPTLGLDYIAEDNVFNRNTNETEATGFIVRPSLNWRADKGLTAFTAYFSGAWKSTDINESDTINNYLGAAYETDFSSRSRFRANVDVALTEEELGTGSTSDNPEGLDPTAFTDFSGQLWHSYGAAAAKLNINTSLYFKSHTVTENEELTSGDSVEFRPTISASYRLSGDTRGFLRLRVRSIDFDNDFYDRVDTGLFAGVSWRVSGKSGGSIALGQDNADRSAANSEDSSTTAAEISLFLLPLRYSRFDISFEREFLNNEIASAASGDLSTEDTLEIDWRHDWSSRVSHVASVNSRNISRGCDSYDENTLSGSYRLSVQVRRWLTLSAGASVQNRQTSTCAAVPDRPELEYDSSRVFLGLSATL